MILKPARAALAATLLSATALAGQTAVSRDTPGQYPLESLVRPLQ